MRRIALAQVWGRIALVSVLLAGLVGWPGALDAAFAPLTFPEDAAAPPHAESADTYAGRDIVVLVDVSRSMDDIFSGVQLALRDFVSNMRPKDRVTLVAFSDGVSVVEEWQTAEAPHRFRLRQAVDALEPRGRYTNITGGLRRALDILREASLQSTDPHRVRFVVLITDGRHNPPPRLKAPSFEELLDRYPDFRPNEDWFIHYITVRDVRDDATLAFVRSAGGQISLLNEDRLGELAVAMDQLEVTFPVHLRDLVGQAWLTDAAGDTRVARRGEALQAGDVLRTDPRSRAVVAFEGCGMVGVDRNSRLRLVGATFNPVLRRFTVGLHVEAGRICTSVHRSAGQVAFQVTTATSRTRVTGTVFITEVDQLTQTTATGVLKGEVQFGARKTGESVAVAAGSMATADPLGGLGEVASVPDAMHRQWTVWRRALVDSQPLDDLLAWFVGARWETQGARVGPLEPGTSAVVQVPVDTSDLSGATLRAEIVHSKLPPGIATAALLEPPPADRPDEPALLTLLAEVPENFPLTYNREYAARVRLTGPDFPRGEEPTFRAVFFTGPKPVGIVTQGSFGHRVQHRFESTPMEVWWALMAASIVIPALVYVVASYVQSTRIVIPLGRLLLTLNPFPDRWEQTVVNLEDLARGKKVSAITIGSAPDNELQLPDPSLAPHHARIEVSGRLRANRRLFLHVHPPHAVSVNGTDLTHGSVELLDKMRIRLGGFEFLYEDTQHYQQVEVALRDQQVIRGVLHSWDLRMSDFLLAPDDTDLRQQDTAEVRIPFAEVEDITVFRDPRRRRRRHDKRRGVPARLRMHSGRRHHGWVRPDYSKKVPRFYFFPEKRPDVDYMIIERRALEKIVFESRAAETAA